MAFEPRPHVSAALQHLRMSIGLTAFALGIALFVQVIIWSVVHFTDVRVTRLDPHEQRQTYDVVASTADNSAGLESVEPALGVERVDVNAVASREDVMLRHTAAVVQTLGVLSAILLSVLMLQGVVVAGGASVPGVELSVTATSWALLITLLALPIATILPGTVYLGVFAPYEELVETSARIRASDPGFSGNVAFYGMHLVLPFAMLAGLVASVLRFRAGIEHGVIVTNVSQLDEKLEREIRGMKLGSLAMPRSVGALNSAIGESPTETSSLPRPIGVASAGEAEARPI